jgi:hypothetical protein
MSVPLAAIPLMAIFGIPQFAPVSASPDDEEVSLGDPQPVRRDRDRLRQRSSDLLAGVDEREPLESLSDAPAYDPFRGDAESPATSTHPRTPARSDQAWIDATDALPGDTVDLADPATPENAAVDAARRLTETGGSGSNAASRMSWREAARELSDRGIENFRLERGHDAESFLFVCTLTPGDAPHVTMRFEAEAVEPLAAVGNVLDQVDAWLRGRFAADRGDPAGADEGQ